MLHKVGVIETIDPESGMHYQFHPGIETGYYPQVHDFYEISLVTEGTIEMEINRREERLL